MKKKKSPKALQIIVAVVTVFCIGAILITLLLGKQRQSIPLTQAEPILDLMKERFPESPIYDQIKDPESIVLVANANGLSCEASRNFVRGLDFPYHIYELNENQYLQEVIDLGEEACPIDADSLTGLSSYPTIFVKDTVFIGFNKRIGKQIVEILESEPEEEIEVEL